LNSFERQLSPKQAQVFLRYHFEKSPEFLAGDEIVASCPFCEYWEINTKDEGRMFFFCKSKECQKASCVFCFKHIAWHNRRRQDKGLENKQAEEHFECAELAPAKEIWTKALERAEKVPCPECSVGGRKDDGCTHMTCPQCQTEYCYVCGKKNSECDKEKGADFDQRSMMPHHVNWQENSQRCPMYLNEIPAVDQRWPPLPKGDNPALLQEHSEACVAFFHQLRAKQLLRDAVRRMEKGDFKKLCAKYGVHANCGYDMDEVMQEEDNPIIKRGE